MSRWRGGSALTTLPSIEIVPPLIGSSPATMRSSVLLPQVDAVDDGDLAVVGLDDLLQLDRSHQ
jgi:hypothetical protein